MRRFHLKRLVDVSGSSGEGTVAEGVEFLGGLAVIHWFPGNVGACATGIYPSVEDLIKIHGHSGNTVVEFMDGCHDARRSESDMEICFVSPTGAPTSKMPLLSHA